MDISPIAYAIPVFFVLIALEYLAATRKGLKAYNYHDAITDLSCGIGSRITGVAGKIIGIGAYTAVWHYAGLTKIETGLWAWVAVFVGVDFCYYWFHRAGHRMNVVWSGHVVHHQSEDYNLAVALRQSWYIPFVDWVFYLPLAVLGFSPVMYVTASAFNTLYQFWIHTETIGRLGPLEAVLNTPSHHRVHHGKNPEYIDRNYGGILIIWDRMFGTFEPERAEPVYGTIKPLASWNPLWANVASWAEMRDQLRHARGFADAFRIVFGPPGWTPDGIGETPPVTRREQQKYDVPAPRGIDWYVAANYLTAIVATTAFMVMQARGPGLELAVLGALILFGIVNWGGLFEARRWAFVSEWARLCATPLAAWWLSAGNVYIVGASSAFSVLAIVWLLRMRTRASDTPLLSKADIEVSGVS